MIDTIPLERLLITFVPAIFVIALMFRWHLSWQKTIYAMLRMLIQLLLIGYALIMIFDSDSGAITLGVMTIMLIASSWIALNTLTVKATELFPISLGAIFLGGGLILTLVTQVVLDLQPWYAPRFMIPLAGMIFANSMTSISLAGERLQAELDNHHSFERARAIAFRTAMIPIINAMFAVGLVSLPGMMTGQILSGVSPLIAARYQIMVMCMLFSCSGISTALFLVMLGKKMKNADGTSKLTTH
jgi:putative ABC transport system permease protein